MKKGIVTDPIDIIKLQLDVFKYIKILRQLRKFLENYNLQEPTKEGTENLNNTIYIKEI